LAFHDENPYTLSVYHMTIVLEACFAPGDFVTTGCFVKRTAAAAAAAQQRRPAPAFQHVFKECLKLSNWARYKYHTGSSTMFTMFTMFTCCMKTVFKACCGSSCIGAMITVATAAKAALVVDFDACVQYLHTALPYELHVLQHGTLAADTVISTAASFALPLLPLLLLLLLQLITSSI
jgi:hypothetical protein